MHFFAQIKPKCHIHTMWVAHNRRSAELDHVLFKINDDGIYESGELTDEQIARFRVRDDIVKLVVMGLPLDEEIDTSDIPEADEEWFKKATLTIPDKPKGRPRLKE